MCRLVIFLYAWYGWTVHGREGMVCLLSPLHVCAWLLQYSQVMSTLTTSLELISEEQISWFIAPIHTSTFPFTQILGLFPSENAIQMGDKEYHSAVNIGATMKAR
jgi:hypothetical protein